MKHSLIEADVKNTLKSDKKNIYTNILKYCTNSEAFKR